MEKTPILAIMYDFDHTLSPRDMQEYGFTLADYQYLEMPQQDGENYKIHVMTQSGEMEGLVFTSEDQGENWIFTGVFDEVIPRLPF